ncbi:hypothetical protein FRB99_001042 [Tulasnella sp. 403]|nr:hypothetical protein FRB99_001042 [Tulasnella sp. 403]
MGGSTAQLNESDNTPLPRERPDQMIRFERSDGDPAHRPSAQQMDRGVVNGEINYMRKVHVNEQASTNWRKKIGTLLQKDLGLDPKKQWYLAGWPAGYELFVHLKGDKASPRMDLYLFGGQARFRSANEFYPHARWLLQDPTLNRANCTCKYCGDTKYQRVVNFREGVGPPVASSPPATPRPSTSASAVRNTRRPDVPETQKKPSQMVKYQPINPLLDAELRTRRPFRIGEVIWVHLAQPLTSLRSPDKIEWWPAVVRDVKIRKYIEPRMPNRPYVVRESKVYRVGALPSSIEHNIPEDAILPYLAHTPSMSLIDRVRTYLGGVATSVPDFAPLLCSSPLPDPVIEAGKSLNTPRLTTFEAAVFGYGVAVEMAEYMARCWQATDPYDFISDPQEDESIVRRTQYQGLWWGAERIWMGDLIRLAPSRLQMEGKLLPWSPGAETRAMLLRVGAIYLTQDDGNNRGKQLLLSGTLYEVAEEGFSEPGMETSGPSRPARQFDPTSKSLPTPPRGFKFRAATPSPPDYDAHFHVQMVAGRYYPDLLENHLLPSAANQDTHIKSENQFTLPISHLTLAALAPGACNATQPSVWNADRPSMIEAARQVVMRNLENLRTRNQPAQLPLPSAVSIPGPENDVIMEDVSQPNSNGFASASLPPVSHPPLPRSLPPSGALSQGLGSSIVNAIEID